MPATAKDALHFAQYAFILIEKKDSRLAIFAWPLLGSLFACRSDSRARQNDAERRTARRGITDTNRAAVLRDDAITDAQSQTGSFPDGLGGIEGIENTR